MTTSNRIPGFIDWLVANGFAVLLVREAIKGEDRAFIGYPDDLYERGVQAEYITRSAEALGTPEDRRALHDVLAARGMVQS